MTAQIIDGMLKFHVSLSTFYAQPVLVIQAARFGVMIPPTSEIDESAAPALAYVNPTQDGSARWIADCPACRETGRTAAEYVWLKEPAFFCMACCNQALGGKWRRVTVPPERMQIERLLLARSDPRTRAWTPGETLDDLTVQNVTLSGGGG